MLMESIGRLRPVLRDEPRSGYLPVVRRNHHHRKPAITPKLSFGPKPIGVFDVGDDRCSAYPGDSGNRSQEVSPGGLPSFTFNSLPAFDFAAQRAASPRMTASGVTLSGEPWGNRFSVVRMIFWRLLVNFGGIDNRLAEFYHSCRRLTAGCGCARSSVDL